MIEAKLVIDGYKFDGKRGTGAVQGGHSGKYAQGWTYPYKHLHEYTENSKICKEGLACNIPNKFRPRLGMILHKMGNIISKIIKLGNGTFYEDYRRQSEFSDELRAVMGVLCKIYFEHVTLKVSKECTLPHYDTENCGMKGYNYTVVTSY